MRAAGRAPPAVTADSIGLPHQSVVASWGERLGVGENGGAERAAANEGDGEGPADTDEAFAAFAESVRDTWLTGDPGGRQLGRSGEQFTFRVNLSRAPGPG
ncbi:hypothetical protein ABTY98_02810 [Streptomyces sp. NPDC096040]|uniref:hypothetical protein n=1 Tax=Streptomyces sp. NPDC096040 TaxID=3155541 RepID=UPI00331D92CF